MQLYLDGKEVSWPALIEVVLDEPTEQAEPVKLVIRGGELRVLGRGKAALTIVGEEGGALALGDSQNVVFVARHSSLDGRVTDCRPAPDQPHIVRPESPPVADL